MKEVHEGYSTGHDLTQEEFDDWRQTVADRESLTAFAIELGLPSFSSSQSQKNRKPPEEEPGTWGEMFEALVAVIFLDGDRDLKRLSDWLCDRFLQDAIEGEDNHYHSSRLCRNDGTPKLLVGLFSMNDSE